MENLKHFNGDVFTDDRGSVRFVNDFDFNGIKRFYQVQNHEIGFIRAWHGHLFEGKYVYVAKGSAWIGIVNMENTEVRKTYVLSDKKPSVMYIPQGNYNGFKTLEEDTIILFFSNKSVNESKGDDHRLPYEEFPLFEKNYR